VCEGQSTDPALPRNLARSYDAGMAEIEMSRELYALVTPTPDGRKESIMGLYNPMLGHHPAVCVKRELVPLFVAAAKRTGRNFRVVRWRDPEDVTAEFTT
jgi:hypothetical protein